MHISRLALTVLGTLIALNTLSIAHARQPSFQLHRKRDLLGLIPIGGGAPASPASAPAPAPVPVAAGGVAPAPAQTAGGVPGLIGGVLNPSPLNIDLGLPSAAGPTAPATAPKKHGSASDPASGATADLPASPTLTGPSKDHKNEGDPMSPGLIVLLVVILLAVLAGIIFSCYKVRQSQKRRHRSWDEDMLKSHAGSVGYSEGGGYGMYVGTKGETTDLWRKNLDMFHR